MNKSKKQKKSYKNWYFLLSVLIIYAIISFIVPDKSMLIVISYIKLLEEIAPIFVIVYLIMLLINLYIDNEKLQKYMGDDAGFKGWLITILAGILSIGSIYIWYPLLKDLQKKGVKNKFIVSFIYNRGIKLQWLPILLLYFGWIYSITLLLVMAILSVFQGIITEKLIDGCCLSESKALHKKNKTK